jgi:hypothetical protein
MLSRKKKFGWWFHEIRRKSRLYIFCFFKYIYIYITDLVCYTYFHWFFNPECQHIFGKQTGYIFSPQKRLKHGRQNIMLHWINGIIRNNKCIFTKLNAVFILKTAAWQKNITTVNSVTNTWSIQQTPMFHGCTITNKQNVETWKLSTSWGHTKVLFKLLLTFKLLKLFRKPVVLLCNISMLYL